MSSPIEVLKDLGQAIIDDDDYRINKCAQCEPTLYTVMETREYAAPSDSADHVRVYASDDYAYESPLDPTEALLDYARGGSMLTGYEAESDKEREERIKDVANGLICDETLEAIEKDINRCYQNSFVIPTIEELNLGTIVYTQDISLIRTDAFALTKSGIDSVLKRNGHNMHRSAHSYAVVAIRSKEIEDLKAALRKFAIESSWPSMTCPKCQSQNHTEPKTTRNDDNSKIVEYTCNDCGATWQETHTLTSVKLLD